jgi:hypothetical protein
MRFSQYDGMVHDICICFTSYDLGYSEILGYIVFFKKGLHFLPESPHLPASEKFVLNRFYETTTTLT